METTAKRYYVPHGTHWPIFGSIGLALILGGFARWLDNDAGGQWMMIGGVAVMVTMLVGWFGTVVLESERGTFNKQVDHSFRLAMVWFIFSEVIFFGVFFAALFYARQLSVPWLAGEGSNFFTNLLLWMGFQNIWPTAGPGATQHFGIMHAWGIPAINTAVLLTSGVTITIAHYMLLARKRAGLIVAQAATFLLGMTFLALQAHEYIHAYTELNLRLTSGIYGSTFFMLTGFHGLHVTLGTIMLIVIWLRILRGHFNPERHFAFEAVAWYWHFVDVVWLALFIFVYWL